MRQFHFYTFLLLIFFGSTVHAQNSNADSLKLFTKTWKVKEVKDPGFADKEDEADFKEFIQSLRISFKKDGSMYFSDGAEKMTGSWNFNQIKNEIKILIPGEEEVIIKVLAINESFFKFENKSGGNGAVPSGTFIPAN